MHSTLIASLDSRSAKYIKGAAQEVGFRATEVNSIADLRKALVAESYSAVFVDARLGVAEAIDVAHILWSSSPFSMFGVFNFYGIVEDEWQVQFIGGKSFYGKNAVLDIKDALKKMPMSVVQHTQRKICLVEDLDSPRQIISSYLQALGYGTVVDVAGAKEAISLLESRIDEFFCIITDLNMPEMSGIELIKYVRDSKKLAHLPILVLTSFGNTETLTECLRIGATGFLVKPPKKNHLRLEMEKAIRIFINHQTPRLCKPEEAHLLEGLLSHLVSQ